MRRRGLLLLGCLPVLPAFAESSKRRLNLAAYVPTFASAFDKPSSPLMRVDGGPFSTRYEEWGGLRTLPGNKEEELYVDPGFVPAKGGTDQLGRADAPAGSPRPLGINPFAISNGALDISAIPTPRPLQELVDRPYLSGMISTDRFFAQRYGYFEMRARLPGGRGIWPAFWMVAKTQEEHLEIDIMESIGSDTAHVYQSTHLKASRGKGIHVKVRPEGFDYTTAAHSYGMEWTPDELVFYVDGIETTKTDGAPFRDAPPMYMIANLAVGGDWAGKPDSDTHFPAVMRIDHIRAYRRA
jgi:hypothetical protein